MQGKGFLSNFEWGEVAWKVARGCVGGASRCRSSRLMGAANAATGKSSCGINSRNTNNFLTVKFVPLSLGRQLLKL